MLLCNFCYKECKNSNSLKNHERRCKNNPNRQVPRPSDKWYESMHSRKGHGSNQFTKAKETGIPVFISDESRAKMGKSGKNRIWTKALREQHSRAMKLAVKNNPESYTSSNRGRAKQITKYGLKFIGKWELEFYEYCLNKSIIIERCFNSFEYEWNGIRQYYPDFYLPQLDVFIEVKGYETDRDRAKWQQFPRKLIVIKKKEIAEIRNGTYAGLQFNDKIPNS